MTIMQEIKDKAIYKWDEQAKVFVACYPELNIYSQAKSKEDAMEAILDAVLSYLLVMYRKDHEGG
jgi:predicted RNase H-like HicB family nuclease